MELFDKLTKVTQDAVRGARDLSDVARFNSLISEEQGKLDSLFNQIGKAYYDKHEEVLDEPFVELFAAVANAEKKIVEYNEEIKKIKGAKNCPNCGTSNSSNSAFCVSCGSPLNPQTVNSAEQKFCTNCGTAIEPGAVFCLSCGHKL